MNSKDLYLVYRDLLLDGVVPFWFRNGIDWEYGGVQTCLSEEGSLLSGDKYIWSQARSVWTFSALYNRVEARPEFLDAARNSIRFLLAHGRDKEQRWVYRTTRDGRVLEGATSIYSDFFVVYGLSEYCRAEYDPELMSLACDTFSRIVKRVEAADFTQTAPQVTTAGHRAHGVSMMMTSAAEALALSTGDESIAIHAEEHAERILQCFVNSKDGLLVEFLDRDYRSVPAPTGTVVNPGHAIESMWFVLQLAKRRGWTDWIAQAADVLRRHLEIGWDAEYGGIFLMIDAQGKTPESPHWDKKLWWPHTEALYALLLTEQLTGEAWCRSWYEKVHQWSFEHFGMPSVGEWRQRLDRTGQPITELIALPVKDPFHLPRTAILSMELLRSNES